MASDRCVPLRIKDLDTLGFMRVHESMVSDRCTSFDIELGCVLSYQDLARHDCRDAGGRATQEQLPRDVLERVLKGGTA